mgnify:CR=1 FL=1
MSNSEFKILNEEEEIIDFEPLNMFTLYDMLEAIIVISCLIIIYKIVKIVGAMISQKTCHPKQAKVE